MRINRYLAKYTELSRRKADEAIELGRVSFNGQKPAPGLQVGDNDIVTLDNDIVTPEAKIDTIILNKPTGYVVSREGQGSKTIYELLPEEYQHLNPVGRLDKDSSGLLLLTNDGELANQLTHPRYQKTKKYEIRLNTSLTPLHQQMINDHGIQLDDGRSQLTLERLKEGNDQEWIVTMQEGRNRQIRRTFSALNYTVRRLHRTHFGNYALGTLAKGKIQTVKQAR